MIKKLLIICLLGLPFMNAWAQSFSEKTALKRLTKKQWPKVKNLAIKSIQKDSIHAGAHYVMARYYFDADNPDYNIDSAYRYTNRTLYLLARISPKSRVRLEKLPLDSLILLQLRQSIDSAAFFRASEGNSVESYNAFINDFPMALQRSKAIELRNEVAYREALRQNTHEALAFFLNKYPNSKHVAEAKKIYDRLLFEAKIGDRHLQSYERFLKEYPRSPYVGEVEKQIFRISTASGEAEQFLQFIKKYPQSSFVQKARNILYHLLLEEDDDEVFPRQLWTDSLRNVHTLNDGFLIPFMKDGLFGFMDMSGKEIIPPTANDLQKEYVCGDIVEDVVVMNHAIIARNGAMVYKNSVEEIDDLGYGFLKVTANNCSKVIHKSGLLFEDSCAQDVKVVAGRFVALKISDKWSLHTLTDMRLYTAQWEDVMQVGEVIALKKNSMWYLITAEKLALLADNRSTQLVGPFDEIKSWPRNQIFVKQGTKEGILDSKLNTKIKLEEQSLGPTFFGTQASSDKGIKILVHQGGEWGYFQDSKMQQPWVGIKQQNQWKLFDTAEERWLQGSFDSLSFRGVYAIGFKNDSLRLFFDKTTVLDFYKASVEVIPGKDSTNYALVQTNGKKFLYGSGAKLLFPLSYDKIQYGEGGIFIVSKKEKKGLISASGNLILPVEMDAIGTMEGGVIPILKGMKFGLYDTRTKKQIKPQYDKNVKPYNAELIVAFKDKAYGFIGWDNKPQTKFEYDEVRPWESTMALVRKGTEWMFLDLKTKKVVIDKIKQYRLVKETAIEKIAIVKQDNAYGVISNTHGIVIPISFSDIVNVGSKENPVYFTEKHVEEASIFVVIYYDNEGKLLRRQAFEADQYEDIYCPGR